MFAHISTLINNFDGVKHTTLTLELAKFNSLEDPSSSMKMVY
jgi:hypothetical protein